MEFGKWKFASSDEARYYIRELLAKYPVGSNVTDPEDVKFLTELLKHHPEFDAKCKGGVDTIRVVRNKKKKATELEVRSKEGECAAMSWLPCLPS